MKPFIFLIAFAALFSACGPDYLYEQHTEVPNAQWAYRDSMDFSFRIEKTDALYNLYLEFVHADTFATQNIYVQLHTRFPDGKTLKKTISFDLFDEKGAPKGDCSGGKCADRILIQQDAFFETPGEYRIVVEQYTRTERLPGIYGVGLMVEKTEKTKDGQKKS